MSQQQQTLQQEQKVFDQLAKVNYLSLESLEGALSDEVTTLAYMKAIKTNPHIFHNQVVMHLTSGSNCLYSIFAAQSGARKVYCVVNGHGEVEVKNIYMMRQIVEENELTPQIEVMSLRYFNAQVDVIIGEPMGYNFIYDGMLDRMIQARDLYLKRGGLIMPDRLKYKCAFIRDDYFLDKKIDFWDEVHGIPMKSMKKWISQEPVVRVVDPTLIVSDITKFIQFNLDTVSYEEIDNVRKSFPVYTHVDQQANGLCMWFEIEFSKGEDGKVDVKASPWCEATRWTHMTLYFKKVLELKAGQNKEVVLVGKKNHIEGSAMIQLKIDKEEEVYAFS